MATPHISASIEDIASLVIMSGDPLRAKHIAEKYLQNAKQVNMVRNMLAFTGLYKGKKITVMGHGMGMGSACIYFHELFNFYKVNHCKTNANNSNTYSTKNKCFCEVCKCFAVFC